MQTRSTMSCTSDRPLGRAVLVATKNTESAERGQRARPAASSFAKGDESNGELCVAQVRLLRLKFVVPLVAGRAGVSFCRWAGHFKLAGALAPSCSAPISIKPRLLPLAAARERLVRAWRFAFQEPRRGAVFLRGTNCNFVCCFGRSRLLWADGTFSIKRYPGLRTEIPSVERTPLAE